MNKKLTAPDYAIDYFKEISTWVSSVLDLDSLLELIIDTATRMMQAKASSLLLLDQKTKKLYFKVATGEKKEEVMKYEINLGQGIAGFVAEKGEPLLVPDVKKDKRWFKEISESIGFQTRSIACVPMKADGKVIGVVEIIDKEDGSAIGNEDMQLLTVFAELASLSISRAQKIEQVKKENRDLREEIGGKYQLVGESGALKKVISDAYLVSNSKTSTMVLGESGTGKELLARLIHRAGSRKRKPMVVINCAALPENLLESEMFGHEKGAFTGATSLKIGKFELADGGSIFLDEIGEMNPGIQAKLLRAIEEGVFCRVGGNTPINVDVRIISATNKDIAKETEEGRFREDLYYRLNVVQILMPALRERKKDIPLLANYFLDILKRERGALNLVISEKAMEKMIEHDWPGNVRELRNVVERAVVMGNKREILPEDLPIYERKTHFHGLQAGLTLKEAMDRFKKEFITVTLENSDGNRSEASKILGIQRTYLSKMISRYGISGI